MTGADRMTGEQIWDQAMRRGFVAAAADVEDGLPTVKARYEIVCEIARGGVGVVYKARDVELGRDVALKVLHARHTRALAERFVEEAQIGGQLQHPGIVPVYEVDLDAPRPYFTMKLVDGRTLLALLHERDAPGDDLAGFLRIFERVCETLAYAHARGVVHRDLKPANVMVGAFGEVQVLDWGFAKVLRSDTPEQVTTVRTEKDAQTSQAGAALGTPAYMAPEQALGDVSALDERTDVFCLGAILTEILTGMLLFAETDPRELLKLSAAGDFSEAWNRLDACAADRELVRLAQRCLRRSKSERPENAGELATAVSAYLASVDERARSAELAAAEQRARAIHERKVKRLTIGFATLVLLVAALVGTLYWKRTERRRENEQNITALLADADRFARAGEWPSALDRVRRAEARVTVASAATRARVDERRAWIGALAKISAVRYEEELGVPEVSAAYAAAFADIGIDVDHLDAAAIGRHIADKDADVRAGLALALDDWASRLPLQPGRRRGPPDLAATQGWRKLVEAASLADSDPWRRGLRAAALADDRARLEEFAREVETVSRPPASIVLLFQALRHARGPHPHDLAISVLQAGYRHHPGDFWINFLLARESARGRFGDRDGAVLHAGISVSLRPRNAEARAEFGLALFRRGKLDDAGSQLERALELDPQALHAKAGLAAVLHARGETDRARELAREIARERPHLPRHYQRLLGPLLR